MPSLSPIGIYLNKTFFPKRVGFDDYHRHVATDDEAYGMSQASARAWAALAGAGCAAMK
jgi:hypothetical protein